MRFPDIHKYRTHNSCIPSSFTQTFSGHPNIPVPPVRLYKSMVLCTGKQQDHIMCNHIFLLTQWIAVLFGSTDQTGAPQLPLAMSTDFYSIWTARLQSLRACFPRFYTYNLAESLLFALWPGIGFFLTCHAAPALRLGSVADISFAKFFLFWPYMKKRSVWVAHYLATKTTIFAAVRISILMKCWKESADIPRKASSPATGMFCCQSMEGVWDLPCRQKCWLLKTKSERIWSLCGWD